MEGFAKLIVIEHEGGYAVVEDIFLGQIVAKVCCASRTKERDKAIAEKIAAALNDETVISKDDLKELEDLAKRLQDRSEYGGGLILSLVNMYRNVKGVV